MWLLSPPSTSLLFAIQQNHTTSYHTLSLSPRSTRLRRCLPDCHSHKLVADADLRGLKLKRLKLQRPHRLQFRSNACIVWNSHACIVCNSGPRATQQSISPNHENLDPNLRLPSWIDRFTHFSLFWLGFNQVVPSSRIWRKRNKKI